jgi:type II secretion system protein J
MKKGSSLPEKGFTLIEIVIVLLIVALMSLFLYETFISTSRVTEKINQERERYREIRLTIDQMTRELLSAYQSASQATLLAFTGAHGNDLDGAVIDSLSFYTMSHLHLILNQPDSDLTRVRYFLEKPQDSKWYQLQHEEYPHFLSNGPPETEVLIDQVKEMSFQYYDGARWRPEWNMGKTAVSTLPSAVRVSLVVVYPDGNQEEWVRQINLLPLSPH